MKSTQRSAVSYQQSTVRAVFFALLIAHCPLLFSGCVPAAPPIQLQTTPGAFVRVDEHIYDAGVFRVAYPPGWRIVKSSIATAPMQVVFVSPDETLTITVSETPLSEPEAIEGTLTRTEVFSPESGNAIYLQGTYPAAHIDEFEKVWQEITTGLH